MCPQVGIHRWWRHQNFGANPPDCMHQWCCWCWRSNYQIDVIVQLLSRAQLILKNHFLGCGVMVLKPYGWNPLMPFQLADVQSELHTTAVLKRIFIQQQFPYFPTLYPIISITQHVYIFHRAGCGGDMTLFRDLCWNAQYQGTNLGRSWMTGVA